MNLLRSLKHRPFALLWSGQTVSRLGDNLYRIALAWWVLEETGSSIAMGTVLVLAQIPMLLFLLVGRVVVDRLPRVRIMFIADLVNGFVVALVSILGFLDLLEIWHVYIASVVFGFVEAFFFPAYAAVVPQITPKELLTSANSLNSLSQRVSGIIGPALGAFLVATAGTALTFGLDAISFFISAVCVLPILRGRFEKIAVPEATVAAQKIPLKAALQQGMSDLRAGWKAVIGVPWIWISILTFGFFNITEASPRAVSLPFLVNDNLGAGVELLGILGSAASLGFAVGAIWLGQYARLRHRGWLAYGATIVMGATLLPFGLLMPTPWLIGAMFIGGIASSIFGLIWVQTLQEMVPSDLLGRVFSMDALGSFVLLPVGYAVAGWATEFIGAPTVFLIGGICSVILAALPLLHPAIRGLD